MESVAGNVQLAAVIDALRVLTLTPHIVAYLRENDVTALEQARTALMFVGAYEPLPDAADLPRIMDERARRITGRHIIATWRDEDGNTYTLPVVGSLMWYAHEDDVRAAVVAHAEQHAIPLDATTLTLTHVDGTSAIGAARRLDDATRELIDATGIDAHETYEDARELS